MPPHNGLPFDEFSFVGDGETEVSFTVSDRAFILQLDTYEMNTSAGRREDIPSRTMDHQKQWSMSSDGRWYATVENHNIWLHSTSDDESVQLTNDGIEDYEWSGRWTPRWAWWSPDGSKLAVTKVDNRQMTSIPVVDWLGAREEVEWQQHFTTGEPLPQTELFVFDLNSNQRTRVEDFHGPFQGPVIGWRRDGSEVLFIRQEVEFNISATLEVVAYNTETGVTRTVFTETQKTFIPPLPPTLLEDGRRLIWTSQRTGWYHLYLYDIDRGFIRQLTDGAFPLAEEGIVTVDEAAGWIYFLAHGRSLGRDMLSCVPEVLRRYKKVIDEGYATTFSDGLALETRASRDYGRTVKPEVFASRRKSVQERGRAQSRSQNPGG